MSQEQLKPSQQEVELDTDGVEAKEVSYEVKEPEKKLTLPNDEVIPEGTAVNEHKDDKIEVVEAKEEPKEDKPEEKENLQDYGKKVQGRINDLTKNWRESQRREKAAMQYAKGLQKQMDDMQKRFPKLEENYLTEFEARRREGKPLFANTLGIQLSLVTPKAFTMGSPANEKDRQRNETQRDVSFSRKFWMSNHEITQAQFAAFAGKGASSKLPITNVSWSDAVAFTNWLSEKEGLTPFYVVQNGRVTGIDKTSKGYRLPTEAEWEFVAKMNRRASPTIFVWGNQFRLRDKQGNFADASLSGKQTFILKDYDDGFVDKAPVGSFKAERGGFYDLDGNVREWVHDVYQNSPSNQSGTFDDYLGPVGQGKHVVKGASFQTGRLKNIRASVRSGETEPADDIGFRIARYEN